MNDKQQRYEAALDEAEFEYFDGQEENESNYRDFNKFRSGFDAGYAAGAERVKAKRDLEYAIQQFTGFREAVHGRAVITGLAESMGLTPNEWNQNPT